MGRTTHDEGVRAFADDEQPAVGVHPFQTVVPSGHRDATDARRARGEFRQSKQERRGEAVQPSGGPLNKYTERTYRASALLIAASSSSLSVFHAVSVRPSSYRGP